MKASVSATGSSVIATLLVFGSSACCVGPLAVALSFLGLSSSTLLAIENLFGPFRPYLLGATVVFLGIGFYAAYRPLEACDPDKACAQPARRRVQRILLWFAAGLMLVLLYFTYVHPNLDVLFGIY